MEYVVDSIVTYITNWKKIFSMFTSVWNYHRPDNLGPSGWYQFASKEYELIVNNCTLDQSFFLYTVLIAVIFTLVRSALSSLLLNKIPIWVGMNPESQDKFPESAFRLITYICMWCYSSYVLLFSKYPLLDDPRNMWMDFSGSQSVIESDIFFIYVLQCGYYLHCVYANIVLDVHRADFMALMLHHVVTLSLISFSYAARYHNVGVIVVFLHDICDVFLEIAKCGRYMTMLGDKKQPWAEVMSGIAFVIFTTLWVWLRLYWYQTKVIMGTGVASMQLFMDGDFYLIFNVLLLILYSLNLYWFFFILLIIWNIITGHEMEDIREKELIEAERLQRAAKKKK